MKIAILFTILFPITLWGQSTQTDSTDQVPEIEEIIDFKQVQPRFYNPQCEALENESKRKQCADSTLLNYVYTRLEYPPVSHEHHRGMAVIQFTIDSTGKVKDPKIIRDSQIIGASALEIVSQMPDWIPGYYWNKPVSVMFNLPVGTPKE